MLRFSLGLVLVLAGLCLTLWLTVYWGILPRIEQWRPQLEAQATRALGVPVRIGAIRAESLFGSVTILSRYRHVSKQWAGKRDN